MTEEEYLLSYLSQEAVEVAHRVSKALFFGLGEKQPGQEKTNEQRLREELCDLYGVVAVLEDRGIIKKMESVDVLAAIKAKREKMTHFMGYSRDLGRLS